jgi:arginine decarboxylase
MSLTTTTPVTYNSYTATNFACLKPEFDIQNDELYFNGINTHELVQKFGTPLKITYLPKISDKINQVLDWFSTSIKSSDYKGKYHYCYCTKSSHFEFILNQVLRSRIGLETSSSYDIDIIKNLLSKNKISKEIDIICNGYKTKAYLEKIVSLIDLGFSDVINIFDSESEMRLFGESVKRSVNYGIRVKVQEKQTKNQTSNSHESRFGINEEDILPFIKANLEHNTNLSFKMLHFFVKTEGTRDSELFWNQLDLALDTYCNLSRIFPTLDSLDIGGGLPAKFDLSQNIDHQDFVNKLLSRIKTKCNKEGVREPDLFSEFGSFTVAESGATFFEVIDEKHQKPDIWNIINGSFITSLPDIWGVAQKFPLLALNGYSENIEKVILGGITCDSDDYYKTGKNDQDIYLPSYSTVKPLYIGFFHTGAYQESVGGFGGIQHCILPTPKHIIIDKDNSGNFTYKEFANEQSSGQVLGILGY